MTAETSVVENHDWKATVTFAEKSTGADGEGCKFAANVHGMSAGEQKRSHMV